MLTNAMKPPHSRPFAHHSIHSRKMKSPAPRTGERPAAVPPQAKANQPKIVPPTPATPLKPPASARGLEPPVASRKPDPLVRKPRQQHLKLNRPIPLHLASPLQVITPTRHLTAWPEYADGLQRQFSGQAIGAKRMHSSD